MSVSLWLALAPDAKDLPRLRGACDLAAGAARARCDAFDQLPVRRDLGAIAQIEGIFKPGAQMAAEIGAALVQRPDFLPSDRGDLPVGFRPFQLQQDRSNSGSAGMPEATP